MIHLLRSYVVAWVWPYAIEWSRRAVLQTLSEIKEGRILIDDEVEGAKFDLGQHANQDEKTSSTEKIRHVKIVVKRETFWLRLFLFADMGFGEGYMLGDFECSDLTSFFQLFIINKERLEAARTVFWSLRNMIALLGRSTNTLANSLLNTAAHYDISNAMFSAFLSKDMTYSCPIWQSTHLDSIDVTTETLEDAQRTKLFRFIDGARITSTDHVLEIGTGWGSFAIEAVKRTGCRVTTITLSQRQKELAEERIRRAHLTDQIEVLLMDYRQLPNTPVFDKIISIEMIEAVGKAQLADYFVVIQRLLKRDRGIAMFQCITMPEAQHTADANKREFIGQYIFPGGYLPSTMQLLNHISTQSFGTLTIERVENIGGHYVKALRIWRENFIRRFDDEIVPALRESYPSMSGESIEVFRRKWEYYFSYCEAGFATRILNDVIITVARPGAMELQERIPT